MDERTIGGRTFDADAITDAHISHGRRDFRPLVAGMSLILLAVLVPTAGVAAGVDFWTVAPVGAALFVLSPGAFYLWLRSSKEVLVVVADDELYRFAVENVGKHRANELTDEFSK